MRTREEIEKMLDDVMDSAKLWKEQLAALSPEPSKPREWQARELIMHDGEGLTPDLSWFDCEPDSQTRWINYTVRS